MRPLALFMAATVLTACEAGPTDPPPDPPELVNELTLPAKLTSSQEVMVYAHPADDQPTEPTELTELTELSYALTDGYPTHVTLSTNGGYALAKGCSLQLGAVLWHSLSEVKGTAAKLALDGGKLSLDLLGEGDVSALLEGAITEQHCTSADGAVATSIPLKHRVVLHVHHVAGFVVEQLHQHLADCWDAMVLPSGAPLWAPTASPLDEGGHPFEAANAPIPIAITLRSDGALTPVGEVQLSAAPGTVSVFADTTLPVQGLRSFEVVGPEALTSLETTFILRKAASKGSLWESIEEGMSYQIYFPDEINEVELRVDSAMTAHGKLCANVPDAWFTSTSSTPDQCEATPGGTEPPDFKDGSYSDDGVVPVATIRSPGECRLGVTIPGTSHQWTTKFDTTL